MKTIIAFNGPPGSGKDTCAQIVKEYLLDGASAVNHYHPCIIQFKDKLYEAAFKELMDVYSKDVPITLGEFVQRCADRATKDTKCISIFVENHGFLHYTPREWLIEVSEKVYKPRYGESVWADALTQSVLEDDKHNVFLIPDLGFEVEVEALLNLQREGYNVAVVKLNRQGCAYEGDSRKEVDPSGIPCYGVYNSEMKYLPANMALIIDSIL